MIFRKGLETRKDLRREEVKVQEGNLSQARLPGDGILMAEFDGAMDTFPRKDAYFHAKLTEVVRTHYLEQDVYLMRFVFRFMKSFSRQYRFRGASIDITVQQAKSANDGTEVQPPENLDELDHQPKIVKIYPEGLPIEMSEREIRNGSEMTAGLGATPGPAQVNFSVTRTQEQSAKFKGSRFINGLIKGTKNVASWRIFEDQGSQSGLPSIINGVILVQCPRGEFQVQVAMSARMPKWPKTFGLHRLYFNSNYYSTWPTEPTTIPELQRASNRSKFWDKMVDAVLAATDPSAGPGSDGGSFLFHKDWKNAEGFDEEDKEVLERLSKDLCRVKQITSNGAKMRFLEAAKRHLHDNDKSFLIIKELEESAGILYDGDNIPSKDCSSFDSPKRSTTDDDQERESLVGAYNFLQYISAARVELHRQRVLQNMGHAVRRAVGPSTSCASSDSEIVDD
ncbi:hypothetical protein CKAH01_07597 [Colletotrichum kahawae]|uniref:Uncharacterized protein n=1 Tax=Colletotrichum kahawae TaxID=34407 RepID=A0AAD9Y3U1_COLKA|nr:hypothetical protein CKAH01_07597 [Colletotrichum kahawae]